MHGPVVVAWLLVALSASTAVSCLLRRGDRVEAVMGAGMALMAVPMSVLDPRPWGPPLLTAVFGAAAVYAASRWCAHRVHHTVGCAAMLYMALAMGGAWPVHGSPAGGAGTPALTGVLLLYFAGYVLLTGARLTVPAHAPAAGPAPAPGGISGRPVRRSPEVAVARRVSMALGMVAMLLLM